MLTVNKLQTFVCTVCWIGLWALFREMNKILDIKYMYFFNWEVGFNYIKIINHNLLYYEHENDRRKTVVEAKSNFCCEGQ